MKEKLDIKDVMYHIDQRHYDWLESLDPQLAKTFSPLIVMKWLSVVFGDSESAGHYLRATNKLLNNGFWELSRHPELQWKLMCCVGLGTQKHGWIPMANKRKTKNKLHDFLLTLYPGSNDLELDILCSKLDKTSLNQLLKDAALLDADIKGIMDDYKKIKK